MRHRRLPDGTGRQTNAPFASALKPDVFADENRRH